MNQNLIDEISKNINNFQKKIKEDKNIVNYSHNEMKYLQTPIGRALFVGRPRKNDADKAKPTDRIKCEICSKEFYRSGRANHKKTAYHRAHEQMNSRLRKVLMDEK